MKKDEINLEQYITFDKEVRVDDHMYQPALKTRKEKFMYWWWISVIGVMLISLGSVTTLPFALFIKGFPVLGVLSILWLVPPMFFKFK